jgi:2-polyprenyl-3-methyl-5-hydroxy-6-metoxy-1,4-benzoquinol methylase
MPDSRTQQLTDTAYWDRTWAGRAVRQPLDPHAAGLNGTVARYFHGFFRNAFRSIGIKPGDRLLEAGCGGSVFLPYFVREFGLVAEGIDNSAEACELSTAIAERAGIPTTIHSGDVLNPPAALRGRYKVVFSMGLAEHFSPTTSIIAALSSFLQQGGFLVTVIPNMNALLGALQRVIDPAVYQAHIPLSPAELAAAHRACGLSVLIARYAMTANFSVLNFNGPASRVPAGPGLRLASWVSKLIWSLERVGLPEVPNRLTSPYAVVLAQRQR